jgi:hypothetical protein
MKGASTEQLEDFVWSKFDKAPTDERAAELEKAEEEGRLMVIDRELFCRKASKRDGRCAGYSENMFTIKTLKMCQLCPIYDPNSDGYLDDDDETLGEGEAG